MYRSYEIVHIGFEYAFVHMTRQIVHFITKNYLDLIFVALFELFDFCFILGHLFKAHTVLLIEVHRSMITKAKNRSSSFDGGLDVLLFTPFGMVTS